MQCQTCGHETSDRLNYCEYCGNEVYYDSFQDELAGNVERGEIRKVRSEGQARSFLFGSIFALIVVIAAKVVLVQMPTVNAQPVYMLPPDIVKLEEPPTSFGIELIPVPLPDGDPWEKQKRR